MRNPARSRPRWLLVLLTSMLVLASCSSGNQVPRPMRLKVLEGKAQLFRGGSIRTVRGEAEVRRGDRIQLSSDGIAELQLASGRLFELSRADLEIETTTRLGLVRGEVLANLAAPAGVSIGELDVFSGKGAFRIDRSLSTRIGVYEGEAELQDYAGRLGIPRLRQATIAGDVVPRAPKPLRIDPNDAWDRRFLQEALDLDVRLTNFGRGLEAQLGSGGGIAFFGRVIAEETDLGFLVPFLANRRSDLIIGLAVASEGTRSPDALAERFNHAFGLWTEGATWGLIAFEFGVGQASIFARLLDIVRLAGITLTGGPTTGTSPGPGPQPGPSGSPQPTPSPSPSPTPSPTEPVEDLLDELLRQVPPLPTP